MDRATDPTKLIHRICRGSSGIRGSICPAISWTGKKATSASRISCARYVTQSAPSRRMKSVSSGSGPQGRELMDLRGFPP